MRLNIRVISIFAVTFSSCHLLKHHHQANTPDADVVYPSEAKDTDSEYNLYNSEEIPFNEYKASVTKWWDLKHTDLDLEFDFLKRSAKGKATLTLMPHWTDMDSLVLDAKSMNIQKVYLVDSSTKTDGHPIFLNLRYRYSDTSHLHVYFNRSYSRNEHVTIGIDYNSNTYADSTLKTGGPISDDKGLYFINHDLLTPEKPRQIWSQGETESNSRWFPTLDAPNQKTTLRVSLTVPDTMVTLSNGILISSEKKTGNLRRDIWQQSKPHSPYLTMIAVGNWAVVKDKWQDIEVNYLVEKEYEPFAHLIFGNTPEMMTFFSNYTGVPFAWDKYSQVVVRDFVSGAMENTTATVHMEQLQHTAREHRDETYEDYISHELFHQWFGDLVTTESWSNITLNESFATYGEYLWREYKYGKDNAEGLLAELRSQYNHFGVSENKKLVRYNYHSDLELFDDVSYQKGACILHMLRYAVGDDAFRAALKKYLTDNRYGNAEVAQLRLAFESVTGKDLNWFFNEWYFDIFNPQLSFGIEEDQGDWKYRILQEQNHRQAYVFPVKIKYSINGVVDSKNLFITERNTLVSLGNIKPDWVVFDEDNNLLCDEDFIVTGFNDMKMWLEMVEKSWPEISNGLKLRMLGMTLELADNFDEEQRKDLVGNIQQIYKLAIHSGNDAIISRMLEFAGINEDFELIKKSETGSDLDVDVYSIALNEKFTPDTRITALAQLRYSGMNTKSLMHFTDDSSIFVSLYSIGMVSDKTIWESQAFNSGLKNECGQIAAAWARKILLYSPEKTSDMFQIFSWNSHLKAEDFMGIFNSFFYYIPKQDQSKYLIELSGFLKENHLYSRIEWLHYRIQEEIGKIDRELNNMDDFDPDLESDLKNRKTMLQNVSKEIKS